VPSRQHLYDLSPSRGSSLLLETMFCLETHFCPSRAQRRGRLNYSPMRRDALRSLHKVHESSNIWRPPLLLEQYFRVSLTRNAVCCTNQRALWITLVQTATPKLVSRWLLLDSVLVISPNNEPDLDAVTIQCLIANIIVCLGQSHQATIPKW
jgi:hypothetical protein